MQSNCELTDKIRSASIDFFSAIDKKSQPEDTTKEPGVNRAELCIPSSEGVPRRMFDALYQSFSQLNAKLVSKFEIKMSSTCSDSVPHEGASGPRPPASESAHPLDLISFDDDIRGSLEQIEDQGLGVAAADRCCMCSTVASDEELMTTPCCLRTVGSICFEEGLQDSGKCCLCQVHPYESNLPSLGEPSDDAFDYKVHFVPALRQKGKPYKAPIETSAIQCAEQPNSFSMGSTVVDDSPPLIDLSEPLIVNAVEHQKNHILMHSHDTEKVECEPLTPRSKSRSLTHNPVTQKRCEPAKNCQCKTLDTSNQTSITVSALPKISDDSTTSEERSYQTEEQVGHLTTVSHRFRLRYWDVFCYVKRLDEEDLLDLVHSALRERVRRTACKGFFQRAQLMEKCNIDLSICSTCSQYPGLMTCLIDVGSVFESFISATQLRRYQVVLCRIQIGTMDIMRDVDESKTIKKLFNNNASVLKSLKTPADIRAIFWTKSIALLRAREYASVTVTFSTAQQANEAIEHGLLWYGERRECIIKKPVLRLSITQCRRCQAYNHVSQECSSEPRCCVCAGMHLSTSCTHDPTVEKECRKCATCGGTHIATDENCFVRKAEAQLQQLNIRFYPTEWV